VSYHQEDKMDTYDPNINYAEKVEALTDRHIRQSTTPPPAKTKFCANYNGHDEHFWHEPQADNSVKKWHCRGN
jgi:hypothetical protein